jgi:hypothetical protein
VSTLPPWTSGPFELLVHAEGHLLSGEDFDRRIALITFDDAIEVAITTYLTLNPIQRGGRTYARADVEKWLDNYHSKLTFLETELTVRKQALVVEKSHIIWAHDHRNEQYHGGQKGTPEKQVLAFIRGAALWVFAVLYEAADVEHLVGQALLDALPETPPERNDRYDRALDREYGMLDVGEESYYVSELLFSVDYQAYREVGNRLSSLGTRIDDEEDG